MRTISVYVDPTILDSLIYECLNKIVKRIPCFAAFRNGELTISCRIEDTAFVENMIADLV